MVLDEIFQEEKEKLEQTIKVIDEQIEDNLTKLNQQANIVIGYTEGLRGTQFTRQALMSLYATSANNLKLIRNNPYFGRFDFESNNNVNNIYVGRKLVSDKNGKILIYDWRSPICSMYYDYGIGKASYKVDNKKVNGNILSKRQIVIENAELVDVRNQDIIATDNILIDYLKSNNSERLKTIIATIQKEQNVVIRNPINQNYIIQGTAGSGKTTVALHRISYLLYLESKKVSNDEFLILGPNKYFLNYISSMLPELDITNINQATFSSIAVNQLKYKGKFKDKTLVLKDILERKVSASAIRKKSSIEFLEKLNDYIVNYIKTNLQKDIMFENIILCSKEELKYIIEEKSFDFDPIYSNRIDKFSKMLIKTIKEKSDDINHQLWVLNKERILSYEKNSDIRNAELSKLDIMNKEIKKGCSNIIKEYFKFSKIKPIDLYKSFINDLNISDIKEYTLSNLNKKVITDDDLAPLLLIQYKLGNLSSNKISHLIIDEAQDISVSQYYMIKKIFQNCKYDIFGDINQSIFSYQSFNNWKDLNNFLFDGSASYYNLNKSYRTTDQISKVANYILSKMNRSNSECIARSGDDVELNYTNNKSLYLEIQSQVIKLKSDGYKSIAIICKDEEEVKIISKKLLKANVNLKFLDSDYLKDGIYIIPAYYAKGLEFDAVIISDASYKTYKDNDIDNKLLYVAVTRAIHKLVINTTDTLTNSLEMLNQQLATYEKVKKKSL